MEIKRIVPNIYSLDFENSKEFYMDFLGLELLMNMDWVMTFGSCTSPQSQITLVKNEGQDKSNNAIFISIEVSNVDDVYEKALERDLNILYPLTHEPWGVKRFFVMDPNGVTINILSHSD